ncbi:WD40 repeat-like protein [Nadsonia fulvescens var. elongata DSM 6958]|uniref:WD40 repeat-like protein n=1 Tax=Nadsonia fulvescens var. elongata DSM 6958 TaxID=857566 RepID=A0A1E3PJB6_9ASCO|nr:WD40 repeat-like protein [Nadsonia fulvescens var. elongata DSM 6958]
MSMDHADGQGTMELNHSQTHTVPPRSVDSPLDSAQEELRSKYFKWKKNSPYYYDVFLSSTLPWPSLTVQWFPDLERPANKRYTTSRILLGTQTSSQSSEYTRIASIKIPTPSFSSNASGRDSPDDANGLTSHSTITGGRNSGSSNSNSNLVNTNDFLNSYDIEREEFGGYKVSDSKIEIIQRIEHDADVNIARYMPQNPDILATFSASGNVYIFDRTKYPLQPNNTFKSDISLEYHETEGFGLAWNSYDKGTLLTGDNNGKIALWDLNQYKEGVSTLAPSSHCSKLHSGSINDLQWHNFNSNTFGSVSDDGTLKISDKRQLSSSTFSPSSSIIAHKGEIVTTLSFNPENPYLVATGSADTTIRLWDTRYLSDNCPVTTLNGHTKDITRLEWSPHDSTILASSSLDSNVNLWDVSMTGEEPRVYVDNHSTSSMIDKTNVSRVPAELLFVHSGHLSAVYDISWNLALPWVISSVSDDNLLHIWRPSANIVGFKE